MKQAKFCFSFVISLIVSTASHATPLQASQYPNFCESHQISVFARPRPLTGSELMTYGLPYLTGINKPGAYDYSAVGIGQSNSTLTSGLGGEIPVVRNGEAPFAYELDLPAQATVKSVDSVIMHAGMTNVRRKISHLTQKNTIELLCLLEDRICSGVCYDTDASNPSVNSKFWSEAPLAELPNSGFSTALNGPPGAPSIESGADTLEVFQHPFIELDLAKMLEGSSEDTHQLLYRGDRNAGAPYHRSLLMSVGNNTFVQWSYIVVTITVESCRLPRLLFRMQ